MMWSSWKNWDALFTRWLSLNGTLVDPYDYVLRNWGIPSNISLSGIGYYSLALVNMYEQTRSNYSLSQYYLSKLSTLIEGLIDNRFCYVDVYMVGAGNINIFHVPAFYFSKDEHDYDPTPTMLTAFASLKLWKWTQNEKFKQLADRVARESLLLAAVNNSTDLAWSQYYSWGRDETHAKKLIWRQAPITFFYTLYGKEINSTYLALANRTLHWQFRAQLPSGALNASIGEATEDKDTQALTCLQMFLLTWGYRISAEPYISHKTNMTNTILWLQSLPIDFAHMENYAVTSALINSWKANFTVETNKIKTATYFGLKTLNFTTYGVFPENGISDVAYGWRWPQPFIASFLSTYPLLDGTFQPSEIPELIDYSPFPAGDNDLVYGWKTNMGFDRLRTNSPYGSGLYQWSGIGQTESLYFFFGWKKDPPFETPNSIPDNFQYYLHIRSIYASSTIDQHIYAGGPAMAQVVSGTTTFSILQWSQGKIDITLANDTTHLLILNDLASNSPLNLGNTFIIRQNNNPTQFFFIKSSNPIWTVYNYTGLLQLKTTFSAGDKLLLARLQVPNTSVSEAFDLFNYYATYFDQTPITFTQMVESYVQLKNRVGELHYGLPNWRASYENATGKDVKLVAVSLPENVNVSQWDFTNQHLTATILGVPGVNSALKIHSGYRFSPLEVFINNENQTQFLGTVWSFDSTTKTFIVNVNFSSSSSLKLDVFFTEDKVPPNILVYGPIQAPEYNDTVTVGANITDDDSGVYTVLLSYWNGSYWSNTTMTLNNSLYEGQIPPLPYATEVNYTIYAADRAENWNHSATYSYRVTDTFPPLVRFVRPEPSDYVSGKIVITVDCQEDNFENMSLYIDDVFVQAWNTSGTQEYSVWDTTKFVDGSSHILNLTAKDIAGNIANTVATVFTDNTLPSVENVEWTPTNPSMGQNVTVRVSASDATSGIDHVNIWYRGRSETLISQSVQMTLQDGVWTATIEGRQSETTVEFFIEAFDKAGNKKQTQLYSYNVGSSTFPTLLLGILVGSCLIGVFSASVLHYRKRQKEAKINNLTSKSGKQ